MSFQKFPTNIQTMFTGFSENGDILNDSQKIRFLSQKVQNPILTQIKALESGIKGAGGAVFTKFYPNWSNLSDG